MEKNAKYGAILFAFERMKDWTDGLSPGDYPVVIKDDVATYNPNSDPSVRYLELSIDGKLRWKNVIIAENVVALAIMDKLCVVLLKNGTVRYESGRSPYDGVYFKGIENWRNIAPPTEQSLKWISQGLCGFDGG